MISVVQIKSTLCSQVKHAQSPQKVWDKKESNLFIDFWKRMHLKHETIYSTNHFSHLCTRCTNSWKRWKSITSKVFILISYVFSGNSSGIVVANFMIHPIELNLMWCIWDLRIKVLDKISWGHQSKKNQNIFIRQHSIQWMLSNQFDLIWK